MNESYDLAIVGAGFTGLTAALEAAKAGLRVVVVEADTEPGALRRPVPVGDYSTLN